MKQRTIQWNTKAQLAAIIAALILRNKKIAREVAKHWNED